MKSKAYLIKLINFYQKKISFLKKPSCVFYPTCSEYTKQAIEKYGQVSVLGCFPHTPNLTHEHIKKLKIPDELKEVFKKQPMKDFLPKSKA